MSSTASSEYQFSSPYFRWLGYAIWFIMAVMSIVFYKERATFMDGGFQLFELINSEEFGIYHYRLSNPLTQILALAAIKMNLSLKMVMIAYSVNFIRLLCGFCGGLLWEGRVCVFSFLCIVSSLLLVSSRLRASPYCIRGYSCSTTP